MDTTNFSYRVRQCSKCPGDTEYYCVSCQCDLCHPCKENHVKDLKTIDHNVVSYHDKIISYIQKQEMCVRNPSIVYTKSCELCKLSVCFDCRKHKNHRHLDFGTSYETKPQQNRGTINTIRSEALFYRPYLLSGIKTDFKICRTKLSHYQSELLTKAQKLTDLVDYIQNDFMCNVFCYFDFKHRCLKQKMELKIHIVSLQRYIHRYEQRVLTPIQFLSSKKTTLQQINHTLHTSQLFMTKSLNKEDVIESLSISQLTDRGNRRVKNECLLKLIPGAPEIHQSIRLKGVCYCYHISCVTSDRVWISDGYNIILTNTLGVTLRLVDDSRSDSFSDGGIHTVNSESELIYIDRNHNINKLSNDSKTTITFLENTDSTWVPLCVYWSPSCGDLLVGMYNYSIGKVTRYNQSGQLTQTIQHNNTGHGLYSGPNFITENNNGDIVVSDFDCSRMFGAVVVTDRRGTYRFSYTGPQSGSGLEPRGICTDALSHILVCDYKNITVQMIDKDGQFLSYILTESQAMGKPYSLSYNINTHRLWVGSECENKVCVYRYLSRQGALTDQSHVMESLIGIPTTGREKPQQETECLLKLVPPLELLHSFTLTDVDICYHISRVTSDRVWVSDDLNNLILINTAGVPLHHVEDLGSDLFGDSFEENVWNDIYGLHTVNSEGELIYIDRNYNINKLSNDLKTTTPSIVTTYSTFRPQCVYWSPATGDLLVAMYHINTSTCKVIRYNQSGQLTQTLQHDNTGCGLYKKPRYITENKNGDIVVSDYGAHLFGSVVVTEREGIYRFSYTGHPSRLGLMPRGICTDALSHILVCDDWTKTVHMIDRDGQFLSHLLTESQEMMEPYSLSYDINTHCLWVGSWNKVCVYKYLTRQDALTDEHTHTSDGNVLSSATPAVEWRWSGY